MRLEFPHNNLLLRAFAVSADVDGCIGNPCNTTLHAISNSCTDVPAPGTGFTCSCKTGYTWDNTTTPPGCSYVPRCGAVTEGGKPFTCPAHYTYTNAAASVTTVNTTNCCQFVPTCGFYQENGARYQCPIGLIFNSGNMSSTTPDNTTCCRLPHQGACPTLDLRPILYSPIGSGSDSILMLVVFPVPESLPVYCPQGTAQDGQPQDMCQLKVLSSQMFSYPGLAVDGANSTAPLDGDGSFFQMTYSCVEVTSLSCQLQLNLPSDGRWSVVLLPNVSETEMCDQQVSLQQSITEVRV